MTHDDLKRRAEAWIRTAGSGAFKDLIRDLLAALEKAEASGESWKLMYEAASAPQNQNIVSAVGMADELFAAEREDMARLLNKVEDQRREAIAERDEARAQLATARATALEEASRVEVTVGNSVLTVSSHVAAAIRALAPLPPGAVKHGTPAPHPLLCPFCGQRHVDRGEWETRLHHTHLCEHCGQRFRLEGYFAGTGLPIEPPHGVVVLTREDERAIREVLWLSHGHEGQYGDDGEMQCAACLPFGTYDYKRAPLADLLAMRQRIGLVALSLERKR